MIEYKTYSDLLELPYREGTADCYGLVRKMYDRVFGISMPNFARPDGFEFSDIDLYASMMNASEFKIKSSNPNFLNPGDLLLFMYKAPVTNHVGIYLGNNLFLHHVRDRKPREDNLDQRWLRKMTYVLEHPDVEPIKTTVSFEDFIPQHLKDLNNV